MRGGEKSETEEQTVDKGDIYSDDGRERLLEDDELTAEELAFMVGWDEAG